MNPWTARARVFKRGGVWIYEVTDIWGKVVLWDTCSRYDPIARGAQFGALAVRRIEGAGHKLRFSYAELVMGMDRDG